MARQRFWLQMGLALGLVWGMAITTQAGEVFNQATTDYELDFDLIKQLAQATIIDQVELPTAADWQEFWSFLEDALHAESVEDLASAYSGVQRALSYLQAIPAVQPYAAWLHQRQDYFDMARQVQLLYPTQSVALPKKTPPVGKIRLVPPRAPKLAVPAQLRQKRNAYLRSQEVWLKKLRGRLKPEDALPLVATLKQAFDAEGVPNEWVWLAEVESSFNPQARSPVGAAGLFQFMPATAKRYGLNLAPHDERLDPAKSARAAAKCLRALYGQFGSWPLTLAAYNAGDGCVARALAKVAVKTFERIADDLPLETQMYVPKVCAIVQLREGVDAATLPPPKAP